MRAPIQLGTRVEPWGTVQAVGMLAGERYYWLLDEDGVTLVSMMPADVVEGHLEVYEGAPEAA